MFTSFEAIEEYLSASLPGARLVFCGEGDEASLSAVKKAWEKGILSTVLCLTGENCLEEGVEAIRAGKADILLNGTNGKLSSLDLSLSEMTLFEDRRRGQIVIVSGSLAAKEVELPRKLSALRTAVEFSHKLGKEKAKVAIITNKDSLNQSDQSSVDAYGLSSLRFEDCEISGPFSLKKVFIKQKDGEEEYDILVESENGFCRTIKGTLRLFADPQLAALYCGAGFPLLPGKGESEMTVYNSLLAAALLCTK